ncbi:type II secretion system minor pseudopilin GspJ [Wenzhouxiangella sp. AB-CW3]|uniref:type II secretion system minor pseudopilin GspJ n=1 Tax=Wenzhouxiangella sp. AB-CW3 TaxID=2771012 RepID=UPI00168A9F15|nr:type II secretion system minor pseudopilin GspJ [Wenzhouxiangella sp. AB-CW3]QOC23138.1 type II secretion system minor pseudopilin GspJ [Wenzhouxiangella sp. AB-CW3]
MKPVSPVNGCGPAGSRGYTLIEVIVAVTVFAFLAGAAYVSLDGLSRAALDHRERSEDFAELQMALARLDSDLRQLSSRSVRGPDGRLEPALAGERSHLEGTRAGWANPANHDRATLQRFAWQQAGSDLQRTSWPVTDRVPATASFAEDLLPRVNRLEFSYRDREGRWQDRWPPDEDELRRLPTAIEVTVDSARFGRLRRVVVLL